ncbi:MAG TPA: 2-oxoacid:acceptor oxidoreductase subunit alpha [Chloroflexota bacterium]|nr:2-oxoacid:acceptor oxidoreductase subunit alpha [Chloroflexota bacterium]
MARQDLVIRIAGEAGEGVSITGQMVTQATARAGYYVLTDSVPPAEIKGGYSFYQIRLSEKRLRSRGDSVDVLLAFNQEAFENSIEHLRHGGILIYDSAELSPPESDRYRSYSVPLTDIAKNQVELALSKNMVAVGAVAGLFGLDTEHIHRLLRESKLAKKGEDILNKNLKAVDLGYQYVSERVAERASLEVRPSKLEGRIVISGNHAVALGALVAGCRRYAGYPITPATDIMEFLADELPRVGGAVVQAEDEIAAIGMVLGASYAGQKAMTATSGPGLSLMTEMLGLASMAEIPSVVIDCQRAGPSTGMPTRHEQGDLNLAVYGAHGEVQRVVLAPASLMDCFWTTIAAFNLAEEFQIPAIVLQDTVLAVRTESIPQPDLSTVNIVNRQTFAYRDAGDATEPGYDAASGPERYLRYQITPDGVSPMAIPGTPGGAYVATGLEHTQAANTSSDARNHAAMTEKRFRKMDGVLAKAPPAHEYGDPSAEIGFLTWGSTFGVVAEAIDKLAAQGIKAHALAPRMVWPLPTHQIDPFLKNKRIVIVPEVNYTGQFANLLKTHYQHVEFTRLNVYGGQPFSVARLIEAVVPNASTDVAATREEAAAHA